MAGSINRTRNTVLGLKFGWTQDRRDGAWGWALLKRARPKLCALPLGGDPLALAREAARENGQELTLFAYMSDEAFAGSLGARDGMTRAAHTVQINRIASQLAEEGFHITICEVE